MGVTGWLPLCLLSVASGNTITTAARTYLNIKQRLGNISE
jgi:hypothetical protein